ncbi:hypothetical protein [Chryseobacterium aahli]|nr:hypothetical protein [Chryseobacterium aahli]
MEKYFMRKISSSLFIIKTLKFWKGCLGLGDFVENYKTCCEVGLL